MNFNELEPLLETALAARRPLLEAPHAQAVRLFNGFYEGYADLVIDLYAQALVIFDYSPPLPGLGELLQELPAWLQQRLPWVTAILHKRRQSPFPAERKGTFILEGALPESILEGGVTYALDLRLNQDSSFYLDTAALRAWLKENMAGKLVLNTFAYTGSLGAAALAGGACRVVQTDRTRRFLELAGQTYRLNGWETQASDLLAADFYRVIANLKKAGALFDCVILDPPFFSSGEAGRVDLQNQYAALINKVRPLIAQDGRLVAVNNALFISGAQYLNTLEALCQGGFMQVERLLPVPDDVRGYSSTRINSEPADPAPFNHATKIAILRVTRKDSAAAHYS